MAAGTRCRGRLAPTDLGWFSLHRIGGPLHCCNIFHGVVCTANCSIGVMLDNVDDGLGKVLEGGRPSSPRSGDSWLGQAATGCVAMAVAPLPI